MKITFVLAAADLSGGNRVISIYARNLVERGHEVFVVSRPRRPVGLKDKILAFFRSQPIPKNQKFWPSHFDDFTGHRQIESYRAIAADDLPDADVVIATWWETAYWVADLPAAKGRKFYFIQHFEIHPGQDEARVRGTWKLPLHKIAIARWLVDVARQQFGDEDVSLVPNAVDLQQFNAPVRGKQAVPTVGLMYSIVPFKGCDISLQAFALAKKNIPNLRLIAFGNRPATSKLPLPPGAQFTVRPEQQSIREIYARCDVWLVASRSEGFGLPILEAMACRTPVIATSTGAAPELLAGGGGVLVASALEGRAITRRRDADATVAQEMAEQIVRIVSLSVEEWKAMSDKAHQTASQYTWDDAVALFENALSWRRRLSGE